MRYLEKSFSVAVGSDAYRANYDSIFRKEPETAHIDDGACCHGEKTCPTCDQYGGYPGDGEG